MITYVTLTMELLLSQRLLSNAYRITRNLGCIFKSGGTKPSDGFDAGFSPSPFSDDSINNTLLSGLCMMSHAMAAGWSFCWRFEAPRRGARLRSARISGFACVSMHHRELCAGSAAGAVAIRAEKAIQTPARCAHHLVARNLFARKKAILPGKRRAHKRLMYILFRFILLADSGEERDVLLPLPAILAPLECAETALFGIPVHTIASL